MNGAFEKTSFLLFSLFLAGHAGAQARPAGLRASVQLPAAPQQLFGTIPVSTDSAEARQFVELAIDKYENFLLDDAVVHAQHATEKDPQFALGYAVLAFASRRGTPNSAALAHAKALLPGATSDEQLLVLWMTSVEDRDLLPAITSMNDLIQRYPKNKHVLFLTAEWLYAQQDYDRSRGMMEKILALDPDFAPVLNTLGYSYIETGDPNPLKAIASLERYVQLLPSDPNPEDSLGRVLCYTGNDRGSLAHYGAALQIDPLFFPSQLGIADTLTLMGDYTNARLEYDGAIRFAETRRQLLHAQYKKDFVHFWEGQPAEGRKALAALAERASTENEPYARFEVGMARALTAENYAAESAQLHAMEASLRDPIAGMSEVDRGAALAAVLREEVRAAALNGHADAAQDAVAKLERFAAQSRDLIVENNYESARGYLLFSQGDFANAADELAADPDSPSAIEQLAKTQEKLGDTTAAAMTRARLKYKRSQSVEWFLVTHNRPASN
jgi:tetratricopeptide (TPR) repeat protein